MCSEVKDYRKGNIPTNTHFFSFSFYVCVRVHARTHARMHSDWLLNSEAKERENIQTLNSLLLWAARVESASDTLVPVTAAWGRALPAAGAN